MLSHVHKSSGILALLTICTFWTSTIVGEVFLDPAAIVAVKSAIPWGFLILIPAMAVAGATGFRLARGRTAGVLGAKRRRMPFIAANGLLVLIPAAFFLASKAQSGAFDATFYTVQSLELIAGAANILLLGLNIRDGRRMTVGRRRRTA